MTLRRVLDSPAVGMRADLFTKILGSPAFACFEIPRLSTLLYKIGLSFLVLVLWAFLAPLCPLASLQPSYFTYIFVSTFLCLS